MENTRTLAEVDPEIAQVVHDETQRQEEGLELIASENFVSPAVMEALGSVLTNKYAEGYPGKRYYGGCEVVDVAETLAIDRAKKLFGAEARQRAGRTRAARPTWRAYMALMKPGDTMLSLDLNSGGHLTHGAAFNFSGKLYKVVHYGLTRDTETHRLRPGRGAGARSTSRRSSSWAPRPTRAPSTSRSSARSPTASGAVDDGGHGAHRRAWWPRACTPRRCRWPSSSPPPRTRRCAARAAASSCARSSTPRRSTARSSPASRAAR